MSLMARGVFATLVGCAAAAGAQQTPPAQSKPEKPTKCDLVSQPTTRYHTDSTAIGRVTFVGGGVLIVCPERNITLRGDSAEQYPNRDQIIGHAVYDEPRFHSTSDFMTYFTVEDHVNAAGNVHARLPSGSTLVGPVADFYRADPKTKRRQQVRARARPTITILQTDSVTKKIDTMVVVANEVFMDGDSLIYGGGQVTITRPDISAVGDSAFIDQGRETMRLMRNPKIMGKKERPFSLQGDLIDMYSRNQKLVRVIARARAVAVSDSMTLKSDTIDLRVRNDLLDHAYAWGSISRARAISPTENLLADSLDVLMPGQKIQLVHAVRKAYAQGKPDTTHFRLDKGDSTDWLRGDTIIAHFDTIPPKDTTKGPSIQQLVATGHAASLFHMAPNDTGEHRPAINYTTARLITIDFEHQQVRTVVPVDSVVGYYIEPKADSTAKRTKPGTTTNATKTGQKPAKPAVPSVIPALPPKPPIE